MRKTALFCLLLALYSLTTAQDAAVNSLLSPYTRSGMQVSILIKRASRTLASYNPHKSLIPASLAKIAVAYVALNRLGHRFRLKTLLYARGRVENNCLNGELIVVARGDPAISFRFDSPEKVFGDWAKKLRRLGITSVLRKLVIDVSYLGGAEVPSDYPESQRIYTYCAPTAAATINDSTFTLILKPTRPGLPARILLDPPQLLPVVNKTKTTSSRRLHAISALIKDGKLVVTGRVWRGAKSSAYRFAAPDPAKLFALKLLCSLRKNGIRIDGYRVSKEPVARSGAKLVASHSVGLLDVVSVMLHKSVNVYAEMLVRVLGAEFAGSGSLKNGLAVLHRSLEAAGIKGVKLFNGSGLSRRSRISAAACVAILQKLAKIAPLSKILPAPGEGTLRRRFLSSPLKKRLFAKTGHIRSVNTLAGVVVGKANTFFAILFNKTRTSGVKLHMLQRRIIERVCR